jgi:hypothetical protein
MHQLRWTDVRGKPLEIESIFMFIINSLANTMPQPPYADTPTRFGGLEPRSGRLPTASHCG